MSDNPGQIVCNVTNDFRLIATGAAAVSGHAARRAGMSREAQEEIGDAAVEVCRKAFRSTTAAGKPRFSFQVSVSDLPDRVEVTMDAGGNNSSAPRAAQAQQVQPPLERALAEQVRCEVGDGYFHMTVLKLCGAQNAKRGAGDSPACH
jgi:hypothetical protein